MAKTSAKPSNDFNRNGPQKQTLNSSRSQSRRIIAKVHTQRDDVRRYQARKRDDKQGRHGLLVDFEQATENGDKAWDIAEFLY